MLAETHQQSTERPAEVARCTEGLLSQLPSNLVYHVPAHTLAPRIGVVRRVNELALLEDVKNCERGLIAQGELQYQDLDVWRSHQIVFLRKHQYYTLTAKQERDAGKAAHLAALEAAA